MNPPTKPIEYWAVATLNDAGIIVGISEGFPAGTIQENEFQITKAEFNLLRTLLPHYKDMGNVKRLARSLEKKIMNTIKDDV